MADGDGGTDPEVDGDGDAEADSEAEAKRNEIKMRRFRQVIKIRQRPPKKSRCSVSQWPLGWAWEEHTRGRCRWGWGCGATIHDKWQCPICSTHCHCLQQIPCLAFGGLVGLNLWHGHSHVPFIDLAVGCGTGNG